MSHKFNLIRIDFKRVDGEGDVISVPYSPASLVQVERKARRSKELLGSYERTLWQVFYAARNSGRLPELINAKRKNEDEQFDELWGTYAFTQVDLDDDGNPVEEDEDETEEDPNPTVTSS